MAGDSKSEVDKVCTDRLQNLQNQLFNVISTLASQFVEHFTPTIHEKITKMGAILAKIKGPLDNKALLGPVSLFRCFFPIGFEDEGKRSCLRSIQLQYIFLTVLPLQ